MRDPKYITTDRNQIRPRVNDTGNGLLRTTTEMKVQQVFLKYYYK